jgi:hypothetical protein
MSDPRFIFETVDFQNGANTINNYVNQYNANCNAAVTGNTFKFRSDYDRMKNLLGSSGQSRSSGYYDGVYVNLYNITVTQPTTPSINGPGNAGWGQRLWAGPLVGPLAINDVYLQAKANQADYVGAQISGYLYSPVATTIVFQGISDDGAAIYINDTLVTSSENDWIYRGPTNFTSATATVNAGYNPIRILYFEGPGGALLGVSYSLGGGAIQQFPGNFFYNYNQM